ncbi:MAG TPA: hypothetical protein VGJ15_01930 [Pirellulales bacterium]|jgi:hypothetical protein
MNSYETSAKVEPGGRLHLASVPFAPGTEVEVFINPKRSASADFISQWNLISSQLRAQVGEIDDDDIQKEIDDYRAGK